METSLRIFTSILFIIYVSADNNDTPDLSKTNETIDRYKPFRTFRDGDRFAMIFDEALPTRRTEALASLVKTEVGKWQFIHPDEEVGKLPVDNGNIYWVNKFSPEFLRKSVFGSVCRNIFRRINRGVRYYPREVFATMLMRGSAPIMIEDQDSEEDELYVRIFLTDGLTKNDYSQLTLYTQDKEFVMASVFPKYQRLVVFNGSIPYVMKPPAMGNAQAEYSLIIKWTTNFTRYEEAEQLYQQNQERLNLTNSAPFPTLFNETSRDSYKPPNFANLMKNIFYDRYGNHIAIMDDVFEENDLIALRKYLLNRNSVMKYNGYSDNEDDDNDNVNWISAYEIDQFIESKVWNIVHDMTVFMSGREGWFPYDIAMNTIQSAHHTRFHTDCMDDEFEYTFLLYLNRDWTPDMYGETMFTDHKVGEEGRPFGKEIYDVKGVVQPRYGRVAIFRNIVNHSARPPSPSFFDSRYTFAVKVSVNKRVANAKTLLELLEFTEEGTEGHNLYLELNARKYNSIVPGESSNFLMDAMKKYGEEKKAMEKDRTSYELELISKVK